MSDRKVESRFFQMAAVDQFLEILHRNVGERPDLQPSDADAFGRIMRVIWNGKSHREAAEGLCTEEELIARHYEFSETRALTEFLFDYPVLVAHLLHPGQPPGGDA